MNASTTHAFDTALHFETESPEHLRGRTQPGWANMVGPFGGITAASLLRAVEQHPGCGGEPRALTVNFLAPIADGDFDIAVHAARINRTNQHWIVELTQHGQAKANASAVFGIPIDTWSDTEPEPPSALAPEDIVATDLSKVIAWAHNYDMRFIEGAVPHSDDGAQPSSTTTLWVRDSPPRSLDFPALAALCDVFYPRVYLRRGAFMPAGTITLSVYFHGDKQQLDAHGNDFVLATAHANCFSHGYFDQTAQLWDRNGRLLATSHQLVYFKDPGFDAPPVKAGTTSTLGDQPRTLNNP